MTGFNYKPIKRKLIRGVEKRFSGYLSEQALYYTYPFRVKYDPEIRFVIASFQRTGSTLLVSLLDSHPLIHCDQEILLNKMISPWRYLDLRSRLYDFPVYGFKLLTPHFLYQNIQEPGKFLSRLHQNGYKIIKLKRRNILRSATSLYYAIATGTFHHSKRGGRPMLKPIALDPKELLIWIQWIETHSELLDSITSNLPHLEIIYENHLLDNESQQSTVDLISNYLGVSRSPVTTEYRKGMSENIQEYITNASEVIDFIKQTKYSCFLEM
jgi:hypothetical protein